MFPIAQTHRHEVLPANNFEPPSALPYNHGRLQTHHHANSLHLSTSYRHSFPIRTSQAHLSVPSTTADCHSLPSEHHLRRKTPNGTIDDGYDASPNHLSLGPPPLKHTIIPASDVPSSYFPTDLLSHHQIQEQCLGLGLSALQCEGLGNGGVASFPNTCDGIRLGPLNPSQGSAQAYQGASFQNMSPPFVRPSEYNVRAFCPPPGALADCLPLGQHQYALQPGPGSVPFETSNHGPVDWSWSPQLHTGPDIAFRHLRSDRAAYNLYSNAPVPLGRSYTPRYFHESSRSLAGNKVPNWGPDLHVQTRHYTDHSNFSQKALMQAHRSYVDILAYLQAVRRQFPPKNDSRATSHLVYPKPPKPSRGATLDPHRPSKHSSYGRLTDDRRNIPFVAFTGNHATGHTGKLVVDPAIFSSEEATLPGPKHFPGMIHNVSATPYAYSPGSTQYTDRVHPIANSRACLEILHNLCEQSDWQWLDGMLLGGCLHYALEQYQDALNWFSRISFLDASNVEATTNKAAALFSLGHHDEAEQTWLSAVKMQPSYLEAAEHLVGLMYKKRSNEAIEVIDYVQRALRLPNTPAAHTAASTEGPAASAGAECHSGQTSGFGSSGYAIAGGDNGRLLTLVHAKGTMLYSLKRVQEASEAFEEAVMISVGRRVKGVQDLILHIHTVLSALSSSNRLHCTSSWSLEPILLPPERARYTASFAFSGTGGELPGLVRIADGHVKRAAVQTTSNSLLSLAKIMQDAISSGPAVNTSARQSSGMGDILALYYLSLSLQESPSTANNVGILLAGVQQITSSQSAVSAVSGSQSSLPGIVPGSGLSLALSYYQYGLRLDPKHVHLHTNLGSLLKDVGQLDLAIQMYERAVSCDGTFDIALTNLANAVKDKGRVQDAIVYYRRAVKSNPGFAEAVCGLLTALNSVCDWRGRGGVLLGSGKYDRWHVDDDGMLQDVWDDRKGRGLAKRVADIVATQLQQASLWGMSALRHDDISSLATQLGVLCDDSLTLAQAMRGWTGQRWEGSRLTRLIERATRLFMWKQYQQRYIARNKPDTAYMRPRLPAALTIPSAPTVLPFHTFTTSLSARDIRLISQRNALRISCSTLRSPWLSRNVYSAPSPPRPHLNVGYVSSDFNNHPLAHLMQSVFGFHEPRRVNAFCYATTASDGSAYRQQIEREAPVFRDVSHLSAEKVVGQIVRDEIHVLVNLNGYTRGARNEIFAARPSPIQMSFMGFAGTLGAEWCDYILADRTAVPLDTLRPYRDNVTLHDICRDDTEGDSGEWMYSENIIFCRDTFFCCDHAQSCDDSERHITWAEEEKRRWAMRQELFPSLPRDAVILGNFNQLYKIDPTTFRSWLRILCRIPKAVLWLLRFPELGESNLRQTAESWAGAEVASRLVFTDVAPKNQHISRAKVCDLFLDTPECNAHTTAADVLWSSTPLLTLPRYPYKMCSRMAASILKGALPKTGEGLRVSDELVVSSEAEYEESASRLAGGLEYEMQSAGYGSGRGRLAEMRRLLWDNRWTCGLFDTRRWVDDLETAYEEAWRRWVAGEGGDIYL